MHTVRLLGVDRTIRPGGLDPTTRPIGVQRPIMLCEATLFGKEFLRMAGIVQMLHAL